MPVLHYDSNVLVRRNHRRGFGLVEMIMATAVFVLFCVGIYSSIQFIFRVVYQSRIQIVETSIANEHIEVIRNMAYEDIGIVNGSPAGTLERTVTTTRNGMTFEVTRTIRNIDDSFDGTIGGSPNDTAPADYKLIDVSVLCVSCNQTHPVAMTTYVSPKYLEGDPTHGALFVQVFDASGEAVPGATVHVVATTTDPVIDVTDTTDNSGMLRLVDVPAGVGAYQITVTKAGYTSDGTMAPTVQIPNPIHPPISVAAQSVTEAGFAIDVVSALAISTIDAQCSEIASAAFSVRGTKVYGTNPDVLMVSSTYTTNGSGSYAMNTISWDTYTFGVASYDVIGTIPMTPYALQPGVSQPVQLLLGSNSAHSLLVNVRDSITLQPISQATVQLTATGFSETEVTGVGHVRQTDWSGGGGQSAMANTTKYWTDNGNVDVSDTGNISLRSIGQQYASSGWLESSTFDLGTEGNYINLLWEPLAQPAETGNGAVQFQLATSNTSTPEIWEYRGPDSTGTTYYTETDTSIHEIHDGDRYMRYKLWLQTASVTNTPTISDITMSYTNSCTPPGQVYFGSVPTQLYTVQVTADGYQPYAGQVTVDGDVQMVVEMNK